MSSSIKKVRQYKRRLQNTFLNSDFYNPLFVMDNSLFCEPQTEDYEYLLKIWGDDAYNLSPVIREQIAGVLRKIREKTFSNSNSNLQSRQMQAEKQAE